MTNQEIQTIRERFAGYDMTKARKENGILITGTHAGNLALDYDASTKTYTVANINTGELLHQGNAKTTKQVVAAQYIVTVS